MGAAGRTRARRLLGVIMALGLAAGIVPAVVRAAATNRLAVSVARAAIVGPTSDPLPRSGAAWWMALIPESRLDGLWGRLLLARGDHEGAISCAG